MCMKSFIIRNWFTWLWKSSSPKSVGWVGRLDTQESRCCSSSLKTMCYRTDIANKVWRLVFFLFFLFRPSTGCIRPIGIMEGHLLYSTSTDLHIYLSQNTFANTSRITFHQISGYLVAQPNQHIKVPITLYNEMTLKHYLQGRRFYLACHVSISIWISLFGCPLGTLIISPNPVPFLIFSFSGNNLKLLESFLTFSFPEYTISH